MERKTKPGQKKRRLSSSFSEGYWEIVPYSTVYDPDKHPAIAMNICRFYGATEEGMAKTFNVSISTIQEWKKKYPEFYQAVKEGKRQFDSEKVESALLQRALGYDVEEKVHKEVVLPDNSVQEESRTVTKHIPGDPKSMQFWLRNRDPDWSEEKKHVHRHAHAHAHVNADGSRKDKEKDDRVNDDIDHLAKVGKILLQTGVLNGTQHGTGDESPAEGRDEG